LLNLIDAGNLPTDETTCACDDATCVEPDPDAGGGGEGDGGDEGDGDAGGDDDASGEGGAADGDGTDTAANDPMSGIVKFTIVASLYTVTIGAIFLLMGVI